MYIYGAFLISSSKKSVRHSSTSWYGTVLRNLFPSVAITRVRHSLSPMSTAVTACNAVLQNGILSPMFFNVYMDDLSSTPNNAKVGGTINEIISKHLMYAWHNLGMKINVRIYLKYRKT